MTLAKESNDTKAIQTEAEADRALEAPELQAEVFNSVRQAHLICHQRSLPLYISDRKRQDARRCQP